MLPNFQLLNATATRYKRVYLRYVAGLDIDEKARYFLQREQTFDADTVHFLFYPRLFSEAFRLRENNTFQNVCIAGFLYYRSLITIDSFFDEKQKKLGLTDLTIMMTFQEEAIKILGSIFKPSSPFWSLWNKRKAEYLEAFAIETSTPPKTKEEFKKLADLKSAFGKVAIDACFMLSTRADRNVVYQRALIKPLKEHDHVFQPHRTHSFIRPIFTHNRNWRGNFFSANRIPMVHGKIFLPRRDLVTCGLQVLLLQH